MSHLGANNVNGFLLIMLQNYLHFTLWIMPLVARIWSTQGKFITHSGWNVYMLLLNVFSFWSRSKRQCNKFGFDLVFNKLLKSTTFFDDVGDLTWMLELKLRCTRYLLLFHLVANQWVAIEFSKSNIMLMALWQGTRLIWWLEDLHKLKVFISMKLFPLLYEWNQFKLCL